VRCYKFPELIRAAPQSASAKADASDKRKPRDRLPGPPPLSTQPQSITLPVSLHPQIIRSGRAVATFEATEAAASVVFRTVASVKAILRRPFLASVSEFTFTICYRPSVCRLSVVCNVRAPYSGGSHFP